MQCKPVLCLILLFLLVSAPAGAQQSAAQMNEMCSAERGRLAPASTAAEPVLRFAVTAMQQTGITSYQQEGAGYLYVSASRVWFTRGAADGAPRALDIARSDVRRAKPWAVRGQNMGFVELQTASSGKWFFYQVLCSAYARGETIKPGDPRTFSDVLEAFSDFAAAVTRVKALPPVEPVTLPAAAAAAAQPQPATLRVTSQPGGAQVYLDDKFKGSTSEQEGLLVIDQLPPGTYRLRASMPGFKDWTATQDLKPADAVAITAHLEPAGPKPLSLREVLELLRNGVAKVRVTAHVQQFGVDFALSDENEKQLREAGADSDLLLAIARSRK